MNWCCATFRHHHENAGSRGITVFAITNSERKYCFVLQNRAIDIEHKRVGHTEVPVAFITQIGITFCPWCGRRLARAYRKYVPEILRNDLEISRQEY